jgi:hypothetical protein
MKRIAFALAVVALAGAGCSKGGESSGTPSSTVNAAPDTTKMMMADTSHMMADTTHMMKMTDSTTATKTPTTIPPTPPKKKKS